MADQIRAVTPGPDPRSVRTPDGGVLRAPDDWQLLPPGDAALTRRVKQGGPCWVVSERRGRKTFSRGVWAPVDRIARVRAELDAERGDPAYARRLLAGRQRRARQQEVYAEDFRGVVHEFLGFAAPHQPLAEQLAAAIAAHATPVGSGTVARTRRIPVAQRAEAATIAWLRHHTTGYDDMRIPRVKGMRRQVRRLLAERSRELLGRYRRGEPVDQQACPLRRALGRFGQAAGEAASGSG